MDNNAQKIFSSNCLAILYILFPNSISDIHKLSLSPSPELLTRFINQQLRKFTTNDCIKIYNILLQIITTEKIAIFEVDKVILRNNLGLLLYFLLYNNNIEKCKSLLTNIILKLYNSINCRYVNTYTAIRDIIDRCDDIYKLVNIYKIIKNFVYSEVLPAILYYNQSTYNINMDNIIKVLKHKENSKTCIDRNLIKLLYKLSVNLDKIGGTVPVNVENSIDDILNLLNKQDESDIRDEFINYLKNNDVRKMILDKRIKIPQKYMDYLKQLDSNLYLSLLDKSDEDHFKNINELISLYERVGTSDTFEGNSFDMTDKDIKLFTLIQILESIRTSMTKSIQCCDNKTDGSNYTVHVYGADINGVKINDKDFSLDRYV